MSYFKEKLSREVNKDFVEFLKMEEKNSELVNKVYKTNHLNLFKQIKGNRPPNLQHIKRLTESIKNNGLLCNPILVNEKYEVIDGQHRLLAAKEAKSEIFYIILKGYDLKEVHALNLNQKNWTSRDFMLGYAEMGIEPYIKLKKFSELNKDYNLTDCIALCSNVSGYSTNTMSNKYRSRNKKPMNYKEVFEEGTWKGKDFKLAQELADKIRLVKPYYNGYNRTVFIRSLINLMIYNKEFDFNFFMHKLRLQSTALVDCTSVNQYKMLIEDIYNYKSREKVNLRY